jgi:hypothetical protein
MGDKVTGLAVPLSIINVVNRLPTASTTPSAAGAMAIRKAVLKGVLSQKGPFLRRIWLIGCIAALDRAPLPANVEEAVN